MEKKKGLFFWTGRIIGLILVGLCVYGTPYSIIKPGNKLAPAVQNSTLQLMDTSAKLPPFPGAAKPAKKRDERKQDAVADKKRDEVLEPYHVVVVRNNTPFNLEPRHQVNGKWTPFINEKGVKAKIVPGSVFKTYVRLTADYTELRAVPASPLRKTRSRIFTFANYEPSVDVWCVD